MNEQKQQQRISLLQIRTRSDWLGSKHSSTVLSGLIIIRYYSNVVRQHPAGHEVSAFLNIWLAHVIQNGNYQSFSSMGTQMKFLLFGDSNSRPSDTGLLNLPLYHHQV